jgi:hypothetical protein
MLFYHTQKSKQKMDISKFYLVVIMSFLFLSFVVADLDVFHNIEMSISNPPEGVHNPSLETSTKTLDSPPPPLSLTNSNFGIFPKRPTSPSGPSGPPPLSPANLNFEMFPKGPTLPSGPSGPPPLYHANWNFGVLPKRPTPP